MHWLINRLHYCRAFIVKNEKKMILWVIDQSAVCYKERLLFHRHPETQGESLRHEEVVKMYTSDSILFFCYVYYFLLVVMSSKAIQGRELSPPSLYLLISFENETLCSLTCMCISLFWDFLHKVCLE